MSTHGLAQKLETISKALRELPDESLFSLLRKLQVICLDRKPERRPERGPQRVRQLPPAPCDPRVMSRSELKAYLQSVEYFPSKADLLEFARRYAVPVNTRTPREEIIRLCLRMIHDIPKGFTILRFLAERQDPLAHDSLRSVH
jgi:hypothetical protein